MGIEDKLKHDKILVVGHITESYGPMQALPDYLLKNCNEFVVISHPFSVSKIPNSSCVYYANGEIFNKYEGIGHRSPDPVSYLFDIFHTFYFLLRLRKRFDIFIGCDCLNAFIGLILQRFHIVGMAIFYECDYTPERFKNKFLNYIYHKLNTFASRHSDSIWNNPPNFVKFRKNQRSSLERNLRVPHGVDLNEVIHPPLKEINKNKLVYIGHVTAEHGLQLLVDALPMILEEVADVSICIIGSGPYETTLKKTITDKGLDSYFKFLGYTSHKLTLKYLPYCGIGLAPYVNETKGTFKYAEPLKVKDYLACGLPVIITKVPEYAFEIDDKKLGIAVDYNPIQFAEAVIRLLLDETFYQECKQNVLNYSSNISWDYTYNKAFTETFHILI